MEVYDFRKTPLFNLCWYFMGLSWTAGNLMSRLTPGVYWSH